MKKYLVLYILCTFLSVGLFAQAPERMSFQAVVRNGSNALVTNAPVGMRISVLQGSVFGAAVYVETQTPTSNANGLVSLEIGAGSIVTGNFSTINWGAGPYFIKTETDPTGGASYTIISTQELLSVPYALYAEKCGTPTYTIGYNADMGGYIIYVTPDGKHGLVAATQDQTSVAFYYAQENAGNPVNHDVAGKKFTNWRIPTNYEIQMLYDQRASIGGFAAGSYWSSVEASETDNWLYNFGTGSYSTAAKNTVLYVRAVRSF